MLEVAQSSRTSLVVAFSLAFLAGVTLANFIDLPVWMIAGIGAIGVGLIFFREKLPLLALTGLILIGGSLGFARSESVQPIFNKTVLAFYNDREEKLTLKGIVVEDPDRRVDYTKYTLEINELIFPGVEEQKTSGRILVKLTRFPVYNYGDELKITGRLKTPFETEEFSYRDYLARYGIHSVIYYPRVRLVSEGHGNPIFAALYNLKFIFETKINQVFPEPEASFMAGLLTGSRRGIPEDVMADFNTTGLTHIIAISGYNIALVIALAVAILGKYLSRRWQFPAITLFVITFTLFVGAGPSVLRAAIMGLLAFYALTIGRQYHVGIAIVGTAAVMVAWNPMILLTDVSFQLSFAAVLGLLFVAPHLKKWLKRVPEKFAIKESLLMTLSAQITAVPLIVFYFDRLSFISPVANILVAPAIPFAMITGLMATLVGWIYLPFGILLGFLPHLFLEYILLVADWLATLPFASLAVTWFGQVAVIFYYLVLTGWLVWKRKKF